MFDYTSASLLALCKRQNCIKHFLNTLFLVAMAMTVSISNVEAARPMAPLNTVPIPKPSNLADFVKDEKAAIALGKALFWDMQIGSDGQTACATCHFHAGVDNRSMNQLNPGADGMFTKGVNYQLTAGDFPFHKLTDPNDRNSTLLADIDDIVGSHGVFLSEFKGTTPGQTTDNTMYVYDPLFNVKGINVRRVTGRNAPSVVNAVFNFRNFWDGRAQNIFNGANPFGLRDPGAAVMKAPTRSQLNLTSIRIDNAALASQAVGPPLSAVEESATGRILPDIGEKLTGTGLSKKYIKKLPRDAGKKLRGLTPLGKQLVAYDDSVLGKYSNSTSTRLRSGLNKSYEQMIKAAFKPEWWQSNVLVQIGPNGALTFVTNRSIRNPETNDKYAIFGTGELDTKEYSQMDYNFALFMGLAIQLYESTLVSDDAPIDRYLKGQTFLSDQEMRGLNVFQGHRCGFCHDGPEFSGATVHAMTHDVEVGDPLPSPLINQRLERMSMNDDFSARFRDNSGFAVYDKGFYNIGVRPTGSDLGVGGNDPFGNPLSDSRLAQMGIFEQKCGDTPNLVPQLYERIVADGAFKVPTLRNVELTGPYFHNGGMATLRQVVEFYNRGGDFHEQNIENLHPEIQTGLGLTEQDKDDLVAFLKTLTDERVRHDAAPFDHPQLLVPGGHPGDTTTVKNNNGSGNATDAFIEVPVTGKNGGLGTPNFLNISN